MRHADLGKDGFAVVAHVLSHEECADAASQVQLDGGAGTRCLLAQPWCAALADRLHMNDTLVAIMGAGLVAVQCTWFEKSAARNWLVPMHQDLSIPVAASVDDSSLCGWSLKEGIQFVHAPLEILEKLVAVRIHLDPCGPDDGPLRVVPGSHTHGVLSDDQAADLRLASGETVCVAPVGAALVMRPLLLHASSKGSGASARRVLHFVFGPRELPNGLRWNMAI